MNRVPHHRVFDILQSLQETGFMEVRQGTPLLYCPVDPVRVIVNFNGKIQESARDSVEELKKLSFEARQNVTTIW